ncbi:MSMEG_0565 family glycosyltransferase [Methylobacterium sp. JK268]
MTPSLRIAILAHSTNPRGGVAHALALAEALCDLGHEAVVHAPDAAGSGFYRTARCGTVRIAARPVTGDTHALVHQRVTDYLAYFGPEAAARFDVFHAQDSISGNALATLTRRRLIPGFARTVHHLDTFADPRLTALQERAILGAGRVLCVSRLWRDALARDFGLAPTLVGNGVDRAAFSAVPDPADAALRAAWGIGEGPVVLSVGGFEARKNALRLIAAFADLRATHPSAQLLVVGGASLLDHSAYEAHCHAALAAARLPVGPGCAVIRTGPVPQAAMAGLYRIADTLAFPSLTEGFGLTVLEAMACGTPTVVSRIAPFTEYLREADTLFVDPEDPEDIAAGLRAALHPETRRRLAAAGCQVATAHSWRACAIRHADVYAALARPEVEHA